MAYFLLLIGCFTTAYLFDILSVWKTGKNLLELQRESIKVMTASDYSDDQKQKILLSYSGKIFLLTLRIFVLFIVASMPLMVIVLFWNLLLKNQDFLRTIVSFNGLLLSTLAFLMYFFIKRMYGKKG